MEKDWISSGESRELLVVNGKPVNPRTFEKLLEETGIEPAFISNTTGARYFKKKHIVDLAKRLPKHLKRGKRLELK